MNKSEANDYSAPGFLGSEPKFASLRLPFEGGARTAAKLVSDPNNPCPPGGRPPAAWQSQFRGSACEDIATFTACLCPSPRARHS